MTVLLACLGAGAHAASLDDPLGTASSAPTVAGPWEHGADAQACPVPGGVLSLGAAVDLALCRNPATRTAWATARQQAAALGSAESAWLPSLNLSGSDSRESGGTHTDGLGNLISTAQTTRDAALSLSWLLFDFNGREARIDSARQLALAGAANLSGVAQTTILNVAQAYYTAVAADASAAVARRAEQAYLDSLEAARGLQQGGAAALGDVLQAQTAYDSARLARLQAEITAKTSLSALALAAGVRADTPLHLEAQVPPQKAEDFSAYQSKLAALIDQASAQRPDLAVARAQRDAAEANVTVARATGRPSLSLTASRNLSEVTGLPNQNYSVIGVTLTVPVFTGFNVHYAEHQALAALDASEANLEQIRLNISRDVWNAYFQLESASQQLSASAELVATAAQNQEISLERYKSGVGSILDLLTAQNAAVTARQQRIVAELGWQESRAQLAFALGVLRNAQPLSETGLPK